MTSTKNEGTMDSADLAQMHIEAELENNINNFKRNKIVRDKPKPEGYCLNCYEDLDNNKLFCNSLCAEQFEFKKRMRKY